MKIKRKKILSILLSASLAAGVISSVNTNINAQQLETETLNLYSHGAVVPIEEFFVPDNSGSFSVKAASFSQGSIEQTIYDALDTLSTEVDVSKYNLSSSEFKTKLENVLNSCPEFFYVNSSFQVSSKPGSNVVSTYIPSYNGTASTINADKTYYKQQMSNILSQVDSSWSDLEKIVFIHDYLIKHFDYDTTYSIYDALNFFKKGKGVCQAYTAVFAGLLKDMGIDVSTASSDSMNHIWNLVKLNNKWYHVDVTWDDPVNNGYARSSHNHLLLSDNAISTARGTSQDNHKAWESEYKCSDTTYDNYFWYQQDVTSSFEYLDDNWYYACFDKNNNTANLMKSNLKSGGTIIKDLGKWTSTTNPNSFYTSSFASLDVYNKKLYFNTAYSINYYVPSTNTFTTLKTIDSSSRIIGMIIEGQNLNYAVSSNMANNNYNISTYKLEAPIETPPATTTPPDNTTTPPDTTTAPPDDTTAPPDDTTTPPDTTTTPPGPIYLEIGDINFDTKVDLNDTTELLKAAVGITTLTKEQQIVGDLDFNSKIDLNDATLLLKLSVGIIKKEDLYKQN